MGIISHAYHCLFQCFYYWSPLHEKNWFLGSYKKKPTNSEKKNIPIARKSIVALGHIKKGDIFSLKNLTVKRPGTGLSPFLIPKLIGKKAEKNYKKDDLIIIKSKLLK